MGCSGDAFSLPFFMVKSAAVLCDMPLDVFILWHFETLRKWRKISVDDFDLAVVKSISVDFDD